MRYKIYTKTGDAGSTSLLGGSRVPKSHIRIDTYGTIDELNSHIGLLRDQKVNEKRNDLFINIQDKLFTIGSLLASDPAKPIPNYLPPLKKEHVITLENAIDDMEKELPAMKNFILPGGHQSVSFCHIARCVCRRAERMVIGLQEHGPVNEIIVIYLNRLSDYLFVLARKMTSELEVEEIPWRSQN